jgi:hypothetical protein
MDTQALQAVDQPSVVIQASSNPTTPREVYRPGSTFSNRLDDHRARVRDLSKLPTKEEEDDW